MRNRGTRARRSLVTVLFTDIVGSTVRAGELGDRAWRELLARHHAIVRRCLREHSGREVDTAGDGFLSVFDTPAEAVLCACDIRDDVRAINLEIRAGLHTGEIEAEGHKVTGIAVHTAARVLAAAQPSEVLVSSTVRDVVAGSDLTFVDRGTHELKGIQGEWHLFAADRAAPRAADGLPANSASPALAARRSILLGVGVVVVVAALAIAVGGSAIFGGGAPSTSSAPSAMTSPTAPASATGATSAPTAIATGPNTAVAIDPGSLAIVDSVAVGSGPGPIVSDGTNLWIGNLRTHTISRIAAASGTKMGDLGQFGTPTALAFGEGYVWIADNFTGGLYVVDPANPDEAKTFIDGVGANAVTVGGGSAWVSDEFAQQLWRVDASTLIKQSEPISLADALDAPGQLTFAAGFIWVVDRLSKQVVRVDPAGSTPVSIPLLVQPTAITSGSGYIWVAAENDDELVRIDPATNQPSRFGDVGDGPHALATGGDLVWLGLSHDKAVVSVATDGRLGEQVALNGIPSGLMVEAGRVWVTLQGD